jgi:TRAP-type C4-dicarboxylate transport system substrate-binding protein
MKPLLASAAALLLGSVLFAPGAQAVTLKIATVVPDGTAWMKQMRAGAAEISKSTEGRVKLKFYPGGVMGSESTVLRKIKIGQLHGGAFTAGSLASVYREAEIYSLPFLFESYDEVDFVRQRTDARIREGLAEGGLVALAIGETGFAYLMSNKAVRSIDDLQDQKVWTLEGDVMSKTAFDIVGISPVPLPLSDVYTGLQTGLVDTVASSPIGAIAFQWHTKVGYVTDVPLMYLTGVLAIDRKAFERIAPTDREIVREVIDSISVRLDRETRLGNAHAREALQAQGIEFVRTASPEELERWRNIAERAIVRLLDEGVFSVEMIESIRTQLSEYRNANVGSGAANGQDPTSASDER